MRRVFLMILAALAASVCTAPAAFAKKAVVIFDPPPDLTCASNAPCSIQNLGATYINNWVSCGTIPNLSSDLAGFEDCLWYENDSHSSANLFRFGMTMTAPGVEPDAQPDDETQLECGVSPSGIAVWSCPDVLPGVGGLLTTTFRTTSALESGTGFVLAINNFDGVPSTPSVVASVPEPGVLGLFGLGLIGIAGAYGWNRRRRRCAADRS